MPTHRLPTPCEEEKNGKIRLQISEMGHFQAVNSVMLTIYGNWNSIGDNQENQTKVPNTPSTERRMFCHFIHKSIILLKMITLILFFLLSIFLLFKVPIGNAHDPF